MWYICYFEFYIKRRIYFFPCGDTRASEGASQREKKRDGERERERGRGRGRGRGPRLDCTRTHVEFICSPVPKSITDSISLLVYLRLLHT